MNLDGGLILGVNTLYRLFCFFKLFLMVGKGLIKLVVEVLPDPRLRDVNPRVLGSLCAAQNMTAYVITSIPVTFTTHMMRTYQVFTLTAHMIMSYHDCSHDHELS